MSIANGKKSRVVEPEALVSYTGTSYELKALEQAEREGKLGGKPVEGENDFFPLDIADFVATHPTMNEPIIDGLLRRGETGNFISATGIGKSWIMYDCAFSVAKGGRFLSRFQCTPGKVLIFDNELHPATLASRFKTVARQLGYHDPEAFRGLIDIRSLRGELLNFYGIARKLESVQPGRYDLIIADAFYRALPEGVSENANEDITGIYNLIDSITARLNCAWLNVHHSSKGAQGDKSVTDVGAGAGSQSRAADLHAIFRPHETPGVYVLEAKVRSWPPLEPTAFRWEFPCWVPDGEADPAKLAGKMTAQERKQRERDTEAKNSILAELRIEPLTPRQLRGKTNLSKERCQRILDCLEIDGEIEGEAVVVKGNETRLYRYVVDATAHVTDHPTT